MVDIRTRHARALAHEAFDVLWRGGADKMPRSLAYKQLAAHMDFPIGNCHIGSMNYEQCQLVIKYSALIKRNRRGYRK